MMMNTKDPGKKLVPLALTVAVIAISFAAIFFRNAQPTHPLVMAGVRLAVAAVLLLPWTMRALFRDGARNVWPGHAAIAGVLYGIHFGAWVTSLTLTGVAASVTLVTTTPILLALLGWITKTERPGGRLWIALGLSLTGLVFIGGTDWGVGKQALLGDGLALLGAVAMAVYMLLARRLGAKLDVLAFSGIATATGAIALLGSAFVFGIPIRVSSSEAMVYLVLAAVLPQLVGHNLLTWCLRHTQPAIVSMAVVGEPVGATILAWLWLNEVVTLTVAIGCAITLTGVIVALTMKPKEKHSPEY